MDRDRIAKLLEEIRGSLKVVEEIISYDLNEF